MAYSTHVLSITYHDPLYGRITRQHVKNVNYFGVEFELTKVFRLGKHFYFNGSVVVGLGNPGQDVFDDVISVMLSHSQMNPLKPH